MDIKIIEQCYNHTAAVLHSTITAQNECRLKKKTETMLQVAKNLFTQLGKMTAIQLILVMDLYLCLLGKTKVTLVHRQTSYTRHCNTGGMQLELAVVCYIVHSNVNY